MIYLYEDYKYIHDHGKGKLYKGNNLLYVGNAWTGIGQFLKHTDNAPEVQEMLKNQFAQREKYERNKTSKVNE